MSRPTVPETPRRLATLDTTAEYLDVSVKTVRRFIAAGQFNGYRLGGRLLRVDLNEVDRMLRAIPTAGRSNAA